MEMSKKGLIELAGHEGVCLSPYLDSVGVWTIGIGATRTEIPNLNGSHKDITMEEALELYKKSIVRYSNAINKALKANVSQEQFDALVSICYNIGTGGASNSTFMRRINDGHSLVSIGAAIKMWNKPKEIKPRRAKEALLFETGKYSNGGRVNVFPVNSSHKPVYSRGYSVDLNKLL